MSEDEITVKHIKVKDLATEAKRIIEAAEPGGYIPITYQRALALSKNPYADPEETCYLLAMEGDKIVGYFGAIPVSVQHEGKLSPSHWLTTWHIRPEYAGRRIGSRLLEVFMDMKLDLTMAGAIAARTVGVKYGFVGYPAYKYYLIDFNVAGRFNPFTLAFRAIRKLLSYFNRSFDFSRVSRPFEDFFGNLLTPTLKPLLYAVVVKWVQDLNAEVTIKRVTQVREPNESPKVDPRKVVYYRGPECVNWMLAYPWVLEEGQSISEHLEYYFTDTRKRFEMVAIELYSAKGDKYMGYLVYMLTQIGEKLQLRLLDYHFETQIDERYILAVALEQAHKENVDHIEIRSQHVHGLQSSLLGKLLLVQRERYCHYKPYAEDSPLGRNGHLMELDYCDGDMPFA